MLYFKLPGALEGLNDKSNYAACPFVEGIVKQNLNTTVITFLSPKISSLLIRLIMKGDSFTKDNS